ncbi:DMBT1 protein, partial [Atractosteus spatula]|nr:DMBT1 protein [Atractosteus spatula]
MKLGAQWGTVCDQGWDLRDATVLCQQLNCGYAEAVLGPARFGQGNGSTWTDVFDCEGTETELRHCPISPWAHSSCNHSRDVGVVCSGAEGGVRLVGGAGRCDGRVEVFSSGKWGRLLDSSWTDSAASVLCRQLGCGSALETSSSSRYGPGRSDVCFSGVSCSGNETHLGNCSRPQPVSCSSGSDVGVLCEKFLLFSSPTEHGLLRLSGAESPCAGRLEVYHQGSWGTVCDDSWDLADSQVVCRQLQCGTAVRAPAPVSFSQGAGPIWLDEVGCLGNESSLWECPSRPWGQHDCGHKEDVTIVCSEFKQLRLVSEQFECAGRAEVFYNGTWGSICDNGMEALTATLICRQLNCGDLSKFYTPDDGSGLKWLKDIRCKKYDVSLWQCSHSPWDENSCDDIDVAGLICTETERLRLVGGVSNCSGRVEVLYGGSWGTVCDDSWDLRDAQVVCRQLGCGEAVSAGTEASWGEGNGTVWLDEVNCRGSELHLWDCEHAALGQSDCRHKEDAGVSCAKPLLFVKNNTVSVTGLRFSLVLICNESAPHNHGWHLSIISCLLCDLSHPEPERIKLSGGPSACSGRVEVLYGGSWGTVCDDSWDLRDAQVVCRQLGCGEAVSAGTEASWGEGNGTVWLDEVNCRGSELHLWDCEHAALGQSDCPHRRRAGVRCADPPKPRPAPQAPGGQSSLWIVCIVLGALLFVAAALACGQRQRNRALQKEIAQREMTSLPYQDALYEEINYKLYQQGQYRQHRKGSDLSGGLDYDDVADEDSKTPGSLSGDDLDYDDVKQGGETSVPGGVTEDDLVYDDVQEADGASVPGGVTEGDLDYDDVQEDNGTSVPEKVLSGRVSPEPSLLGDNEYDEPYEQSK